MDSVKRLARAGVFAALICLTTAYILHIPLAGGGYIHPGDAFVYLAACLLPWPYAFGAAAIGGAAADLLTAPMWAPWTFVIKGLCVLAFSRRSQTLLRPRNLLACALGAVINLGGYFIATWALLGERPSLLAYLPGELIQAGASVVLFVILALVIDRAGLRKLFEPM